MKDLENNIFISLNNKEYEYLRELCNSMYNALKKLPKKMRTDKFYILENMLKNTFTE